MFYCYFHFNSFYNISVFNLSVAKLGQEPLCANVVKSACKFGCHYGSQAVQRQVIRVKLQSVEINILSDITPPVGEAP